MVTIYLPYPISINKAFAGKKRRYQSKEYKAWQDGALRSLVAQRRMYAGLWDYRGPLTFVLEAIRPTLNRKRDIANLEKVVTDTLVKGGIIYDDSQIISNTQRWVGRSPDFPEWAGCRVIIEGVMP